MPYMFIVLQVTVDQEAAKGVDATWGVRISGDQGGSWKVQVKDGKLTYEEASVAACPVVFNFDPNDWVLTAYQRFPGGAAIGDRASSTHWFHDLGHGNLLAFFDFPEDPMPPTRESVGGMHHVSISVPRDQFDRIRGELDKRGIEYFGPDRVENSLYFKGPDGEMLEIEADPLEVMEGRPLAQ